MSNGKPIIIFSMPRSGSSLTTMMLSKAGVFTGETKPADKFNPNGYYENISINSSVVGYLRSTDRLGLGFRYHPTYLEPAGLWFKETVLQSLHKQGFEDDGINKWAYKDPKNVWVWRTWHEHFPDADFLIVRRDREEVMQSIERSPWMNRYDNPYDWERMLLIYEYIFDTISQVHKNTHTFNISDVMKGELKKISLAFHDTGVDFSADVYNCIDRKLWNKDKRKK